MARKSNFDTAYYRTQAINLRLQFPYLRQKVIAEMIGCSPMSVCFYLKRIKKREDYYQWMTSKRRYNGRKIY